MEPTEAAIVVTPDAGIPFPQQVRGLVDRGHGVVALGKGPGGRPTLFVTGPDRATVRATVAQLLGRLKPHFLAFRWEQ